jgi:hypothetical protein
VQRALLLAGVAHARPQPPQLLTSVCGSTHIPPQRVGVAPEHPLAQP